MVLFVFESADAEETLVEVAAALDQLDHAPFVSTHVEVLTRQEVLGESWRPPPPQTPGRRSLHDLGSAMRLNRRAKADVLERLVAELQREALA